VLHLKRANGGTVTVSQHDPGSFTESYDFLDVGTYTVYVNVQNLASDETTFTVVENPNTIYNAPGSSTPGCEDTDSCFIPDTLTVNVGDTITWYNSDNAAHTATSGSATDGPDGVWDSSAIQVNGSYSVTLVEAGTYPYFCMVHPWMSGTVIVGDGGSSAPVLDTVPPQVLVPDDIVIETDNQNGATATFNPQAIDNIDELLTPSCNYSSGSVFPIGTTEVTCTATDSAGNSSSNSFNVTIEFSGILIPDWVKDVAGWWHEDEINDASFLEGIAYLIENNVIVVPTTEAGSGGGEVPEWVKNNAGWWADGSIDDETFVNAIQYLIQQGILQV
jgi:plastocyanin